jgi:DNA-binding CsgD family transcriptional regulator/type II secretory pathway predicted ATPase ExeA/tetratricopeptide (TPR) repeat protein
MAWRGVLVGRTHETAEAQRALADPSVPGLVIAGAGGVGKTHLARTCLDMAEADGHAVASAIATRAASAIPLGALVELVGEPSDRPQRLLPAARDALLERAADRPVLLHVDDAHLLDPTSAALLLLLADEEQVRTVVTLRTGEPAPDPITALWKDAGAVRIDLAPLSDQASHELAEAVAGGPLDEPSHIRLRHAAQGFPLAIVELVGSASRSGMLVEELGVLRLRGDIRINDRITEVIGDRLDGLDDDELSTLALIALGEPLDLDTVERLGRHDAVARLERLGLATVTDSGLGQSLRVRLVHPLHGDVALGAIGELAKRDLLAALADDLAPRATTTEERLRVANWSIDGGLDTDVDLLLDGARHLWQRMSHQRAAELAGAAWRQLPSAESGLMYGYALGRTGYSEQAEEVLAAAWDMAADDRSRLLVGHTRCDNLFRGLARHDEALRRNGEIERSTTDADVRAEVRAHRSTFMIQMGRISDGLDLLTPILEAKTPDRAFVTASYAAGLALVAAGRTREALDVAIAALPIHERVWQDDVFSTEPGIHYVNMVLALAEAGRLAEAYDIAEAGVAVAGELGRGYGFGFFTMLKGHVLLRRGRPVDAARSCREGTVALLSSGYPGTARWAMAAIATGSAIIGDLGSAIAALAEIDMLAERTPIGYNEGVVDEARGWVRVMSGDPEEGRRGMVAAATSHLEAGRLADAGLVAHALARLGGASEALPLLERCAAIADGDLAPLRRDHAAALAADDAAALDDVAERSERLGAELVAAEAYAEAAHAHQRSGNVRAVAASAREAARLSERCQGARTPALQAPAAAMGPPLTRREREVASLVASGLTSPEAAERLHVSTRTVDNHLQRVYRKLGVSSRAELAEVLGTESED